MVAEAKPRTFLLRGITVRARDLVDQVLVDPLLPRGFDDTDNKCRPAEHGPWWGVPFIISFRPSAPDADFLRAFPDGVRYDLRCLDGGAWDRSTWWGSFASAQLAAAEAKTRPTYSVYAVTQL
jgi:hypothetical protein